MKVEIQLDSKLNTCQLILPLARHKLGAKKKKVYTPFFFYYIVGMHTYWCRETEIAYITACLLLAVIHTLLSIARDIDYTVTLNKSPKPPKL